MKAILLDTRPWAWTLDGYDNLPAAARDAIERAETIFLSPASFLEIGQRVKAGQWLEMSPYVHQLSALLEEQGGMVAALEPTICVDAAMMD